MAKDLLIRSYTHPRVFTRATWADEWVEQPAIFVRTVEFSLSSIGKAIMFYPYGAVISGKEQRYSDRTPYSLHDHFCRVEIYPTDADQEPIYFYGVFVVDDLDSHGSDASRMSGNQTLTAYSLEYLLTRVQVVTTMVANSSGEADFRILRTAATFNGFKSDRSSNRLQAANRELGADLFSDDFSDAAIWNSTQIATYLMRYIKEGTGQDLIPGMTFTVQDGGVAHEPDELQATGQTVYQLLNALYPPTRGAAWKLEPSPTADSVVLLKTFSIADGDVTLPDESVITAAKVQKTIEVFDDGEVDVCQITSDKSTKYDRVIVEGGQFGAVFTLETSDQLEKDWEELDEIMYRVGAVAEDGYAAADKSEQRSRNDAVRSSEVLSHVYARFRLKRDWDGEASGYKVFPEPVNDEKQYDPNNGEYKAGVIGKPQAIWWDSLRFLPYLPLRTQVDYSKEEEVSSIKPGSVPDFRRPFVVAKLFKDGQVTQNYVNLSTALETAADDEGINLDITATVEMQEHQPGILIRPNKPPHCLQNDKIFDGTDLPTQPSHVIAGDDGPIANHGLWVTVYAMSGNNVVVWEPETYEPQGAYLSELVIRLGDRARVDVIAPRTVVDVRDFKLVQTPSLYPTMLRDDRVKMRTIAKRAWNYYSRYRNMLSIRYKRIHSELQLGDLITRIQLGRPEYVKDGNNAFLATTANVAPDTINNELLVAGDGAAILFNGIPAATGNQTVTPGATIPGQRFITIDETNQEVNTVVSRIVYNFMAGTTEIQTQFAEISFA